MLNPMQKDLLTELVNVYVGQAASLLSEMTGRQVNLCVPEAELIMLSNLKRNEKPALSFFSLGHVVSSSIRFGYDFQGKAFLTFPVEQVKILVHACLEDNLPMEYDENEMDLIDTDFDVLREIANIILNSIVGGFGNLLSTKLEYSLPEVELIFISESDQQMLFEKEAYALVLHTNFSLAGTEIQGTIIIVLSMNSVSQLLYKIDEMLVRET
jgi:chemotaxis protein CheC